MKFKVFPLLLVVMLSFALTNCVSTQMKTAPSKRSMRKLVGKKYKIREKIGEGALSPIYRITAGNKEYALKMIAYPGSTLSTPHAKLEASMMEKFKNSKYIVDFYKFKAKIIYYKERKQFFAGIIMELMDRSLKDCLQTEVCLKQIQANLPQTVVFLLRGLREMHSKGVAHFDIKTGNIAVKGDQVKFIDFGMARTPAPGEIIKARLGTVGYFEIEKKNGFIRTGIKSDNFALGMVLLQLVDPVLRKCFDDYDNCESKKYKKYIRDSSNVKVKYEFFNDFCPFGKIKKNKSFEQLLKCFVVKYMTCRYKDRKDADFLVKEMEQYTGIPPDSPSVPARSNTRRFIDFARKKCTRSRRRRTLDL